MKKAFFCTSCGFLVLTLITTSTLPAQNVGIGISTPTNKLHVAANSPAPLKVENLSGSASEIQFTVSGGTRGFVGAYNGIFEMVTVGSTPITFGTDLLPRMAIGANGNVGIGNNISPAERLVIQEGNLQLLNSGKGIILNAAEQPIITRAYDAFTSGSKQGVGRWGLFMEANRLTLGMPNAAGKSFEIAAYNANSTRSTLLTVNEIGQMSRPATGTADLLPVAMGFVSENGTIISGTGNFSIAPEETNGLKEISIAGHNYTSASYITVISCVSDAGMGPSASYGVSQQAANGKLRVWTFMSNGNANRCTFQFVVYKLQ
jgi:hypothetical protein